MTTTAGHSFYIGPIGFFYNQVNDTGSWEPLVFITLSGISCVTILKYTLILSLQFTESTENKTSNQKESQIILEINSFDM
jgi:hypothetical protein